MDDVTISKAQLKALVKMNDDIVITAKHDEESLIYVERAKHRGDRGEGKWMKRDGGWRD